MIALVDADALIYIIAWNHKESSVEAVKESCDNFLRDILLLTGSDKYIGVFSSKTCFRNESYKYASYKGQRKDKEDWLLSWEKVIKDHFIDKHGFVQAEDLEADDICVAASFLISTEPTVICSPDKDLRQVQGLFYNFAPKKPEAGDSILPNPVEAIYAPQANYTFWLSVLTGDMTDNVYGVPGLGPVKAKKLLDEAMDPIQYKSIVQGAYAKYFQSYYGGIIFQETIDAIMMIQPNHRLWNTYRLRIETLVQGNVHELKTSKGFFDV